jgi:hypothetical protein
VDHRPAGGAGDAVAAGGSRAAAPAELLLHGARRAGRHVHGVRLRRRVRGAGEHRALPPACQEGAHTLPAATSMAFGFDGVYEEPENTALYRQHVKKVRTPSLLPRPWRSASTACTRSRRTPRSAPACQEGKHAPTTGAPAANLPIQQGAVCRTPARFQQHQVEYWCSGVCSDNALGCVS